MLASDIQAVILAAGRGSRMTQLIGANTVPKCLLRVCGNPLIFYPLKTLAKYGFQEVLIIIQDGEDGYKEIEKLGSRVGIRTDFLAIPEDAEDFGTLQSLRIFMKSNKLNKLKKDILLLSCDTITDVPIQRLINFHKTYSASGTVLFVKHFVPSLPPGSKLPGPKNKVKLERDIVGLRPSNNQLIFLASEADFDEELKIPVGVLHSSPHTKLYSSLADVHMYIFKREVLEKYVNTTETSELLSVKGEFLPFLIQEQLKMNKDTPTSTHQNEQLSLYGVLQPESHCIRVNTISAYSTACKSVDWLKQAFPNEIESRPKDTQIAKTAKLIGTQLGDQCTIGEKVKLVNVISMDNVTIEDGATVENSIISSSAIIGTKAVVRECLVGPGFQVPEGGRFVNEHLTVMEETFFED